MTISTPTTKKKKRQPASDLDWDVLRILETAERLKISSVLCLFFDMQSKTGMLSDHGYDIVREILNESFSSSSN